MSGLPFTFPALLHPTRHVCLGEKGAWGQAAANRNLICSSIAPTQARLTLAIAICNHNGRASAHARDSLFEHVATIALLSHHHPTRCCLSQVTNGLQVRQIYWPVDCDSHVSVSAWASSSKGMTRKPRSIIPLLLSFLRLLLTMRKAPCLPPPPPSRLALCARRRCDEITWCLRWINR